MSYCPFMSLCSEFASPYWDTAATGLSATTFCATRQVRRHQVSVSSRFPPLLLSRNHKTLLLQLRSRPFHPILCSPFFPSSSHQGNSRSHVVQQSLLHPRQEP